jgi:hypothetical protein
VEDEVNKQSQNWMARAAFVAMLVLASACGTSSSSGLPQANNPSTGNNKPIDTTPGGSTGPAWLSNRVDINLPTCTGNTSVCDTGKNISGLIDLAGNVFTPLIETHFNLSLPYTYSSSLTGATVSVGFEDNLGFWGATIPGFEGAVTNQGGQIDMIFSDSLDTIRVTANLASDQMQAATIYYRHRQSGETQCQKTSYSCWVDYGNGPQPSSNCPTSAPTNTDVSVCKSYMNLGNAAVKQLGTFTSTYSRWAK